MDLTITARETRVDLTSENLASIVAWAMSIDCISEVWLFGSRARGTARFDSDFDVAVVVHPGPPSRETADALWWFESEAWKKTLVASLDAHVSFYMLDHLPEAPRGDAVRIWVRPAPS